MIPKISQNCNWLSAGAGEQGFDNSQVYQVEITDMDIEADTLCRWDSLEIIFGNGYRKVTTSWLIKQTLIEFLELKNSAETMFPT